VRKIRFRVGCADPGFSYAAAGAASASAGTETVRNFRRVFFDIDRQSSFASIAVAAS
jgi:hypothetical protein